MSSRRSASTQFNIYLMHDAQEATLDGYGADVITRFLGR